ncbi:hypothetical protein P9G84_04855 [Brevibacillus centrosporus]|uniref:hypothetical protein n=1 Tax=Brevibacillus centrosporus TaxID=54910 RepID=UPI00117547F3|nr:hypothetical protein [Brevibacillus centrosporus]MEC2128320.1 hypothetical protein [Brevibacillus centrosporus]GED28891.1 hypothetical protein BCE02nite_00320 [Brevibacillus centrosporus]
MAVISIEGASAAGKTATSSELAAKFNGYHIPEVNAWWEPPDSVYPEWFFERQVDRWQIAEEKGKNHPFVVIDIDLFQPLWYNWAFDFLCSEGSHSTLLRSSTANICSQRRSVFQISIISLVREKQSCEGERKEIDLEGEGGLK